MKCKYCEHFTQTSDMWGKCSEAKTGEFINKTKSCPEGYRCKHTNSRYINQPACGKFRYKKKGMVKELC